MDDLISRQGMCDSLNKYRIEKMLEGKDVSLVWECIDKVLQEPSAQRTGRWIEHRDYPRLAYLCSECNHFTTVESYYCPYCGAKMEADNDEWFCADGEEKQ